MSKQKRTYHHTIHHTAPAVTGLRKTASLKNSNSLAQILREAVACHQAGDFETAESGYRTILDANPDHPDALHLMGMISSQKGDLEKSVRLIRQAIRLFPNSEIYYNNLGNALARLDRIDEAILAYQQALRINPNSVDAINNLAINLKELGQLDDALGYFKRALQINPEKAEVYNNMGNTLTDLGQIDSAIACFYRAIALKPDYAIAYNNLGTALKMRERFDKAIASYSQAVRLNPDYAEALNNFGETLADMGKPDEAIPFFQKALEIKPAFGLPTGNLVYALTRICAWTQLEHLNHQLDIFTDTAIKHGAQLPEDPFLNLVRHDSPERNYAVASAWSAKTSKRASHCRIRFKFKERNVPHKKLVIGYLSNNFHDHPMAHLISRLLAVHDRKAVEVLCFSTGRDDGSEYRQRMVKGCDRFVDIRHLNHHEAAKRINEAEVDILVDLMGHNQGQPVGRLCHAACSRPGALPWHGRHDRRIFF